MMLSEFDIENVHRKTIKGQAIADQLVDSPKFLNESIFIVAYSKPCKLYFDGSYM